MSSVNCLLFAFQPLCDAVVGKALTVKVKFQNPLPCVLKNVILRFEGLGMRDIKTINYGWENVFMCNLLDRTHDFAVPSAMP